MLHFFFTFHFCLSYAFSHVLSKLVCVCMCMCSFESIDKYIYTYVQKRFWIAKVLCRACALMWELVRVWIHNIKCHFFISRVWHVANGTCDVGISLTTTNVRICVFMMLLLALNYVSQITTNECAQFQLSCVWSKMPWCEMCEEITPSKWQNPIDVRLQSTRLNFVIKSS